MRACKVCGGTAVSALRGPATCKSCQKETTRRYQQSNKGKETLRRYLQSSEGQEAIRRRRESGQTKRKYQRWQHSTKGQQYRASARFKLSRQLSFAKRRALIHATEAPLTSAEWMDILSRAKGRCYYCKTQAKLTGPNLMHALFGIFVEPMQLASVLHRLTRQERLVVVLYYGFESRPLVQQAIAERMNLSQGRISAIHKNALRKMRGAPYRNRLLGI